MEAHLLRPHVDLWAINCTHKFEWGLDMGLDSAECEEASARSFPEVVLFKQRRLSKWRRPKKQAQETV
jgi:hypothetical protein